ncbi:MAG TPA: hypothetical protein VHZ74_06285 [Bryobacteraceae bacterium]|nr:hypothetical protein [Bryobacteraceae bacterium]
MPDRDQVLQVLHARVEDAKTRHELAQAAFWSVAADPRQLPRFPTGRLQLDGSDKIREAFRIETEAREEFLEALRCFSDFLAEETGPVDHEETLFHEKAEAGHHS